jgi:hypothetical protein
LFILLGFFSISINIFNKVRGIMMGFGKDFGFVETYVVLSVVGMFNNGGFGDTVMVCVINCFLIQVWIG